MIFFVITADWGIARTTWRVRVPLFVTTRLTASATSSNFSIWPSAIQPFSKLSEPNRSSTYSPEADWPNSTSLTLDELMSKPIIGANLRPIKTSRKLTVPLLSNTQTSVELLISHFNASSKALEQQRSFPLSRAALVANLTPNGEAAGDRVNSRPGLYRQVGRDTEIRAPQHTDKVQPGLLPRLTGVELQPVIGTTFL